MVYIDRNGLTDFCRQVFRTIGLSEIEADDSAKILVDADARGIASHGVSRLQRYVYGIQEGVMVSGVKPTVLRETPISYVLDGNGAMGLSLSRTTMDTVISKAKEHGVCFSSVRNSNHFGIAGFYAEMAARHDMIGIGMTNTAAMGVPTFARDPYFGTNPIAVAVPASNGRIFCLDMATTVVTRGKIEIHAREGKDIPSGWAVDTTGHGTNDPVRLIEDMLYLRGGGLMPLGGEGEMLSGYKGYGLATVVDIMTALLSGGPFGRDVMDSENTSARVCHFFGAIQLDLFRDPEAFKADMGRMLDELNALRPAEGCERVYYAGQKEHEAEERSWKCGVPVTEKLYDELCGIGLQILGRKLERLQ
ncbi:MAG: Ldh family oxidoreductase [Sphaerochaetaceae bacterium]|nr:Ldh family oxidoreductase [Sphaerochaetaceae bacterium]